MGISCNYGKFSEQIKWGSGEVASEIPEPSFIHKEPNHVPPNMLFWSNYIKTLENIITIKL